MIRLTESLADELRSQYYRELILPARSIRRKTDPLCLRPISRTGLNPRPWRMSSFSSRPIRARAVIGAALPVYGEGVKPFSNG